MTFIKYIISASWRCEQSRLWFWMSWVRVPPPTLPRIKRESFIDKDSRLFFVCAYASQIPHAYKANYSYPSGVWIVCLVIKISSYGLDNPHAHAWLVGLHHPICQCRHSAAPCEFTAQIIHLAKLGIHFETIGNLLSHDTCNTTGIELCRMPPAAIPNMIFLPFRASPMLP